MLAKGLSPPTANSIPPPGPVLLSIMSTPLRTSGYSNEPTGADYSHGEKEDKRSVTFMAKMVDAGLDPDETSDINPGGLTFEEGLSLQLCLQEISLTRNR